MANELLGSLGYDGADDRPRRRHHRRARHSPEAHSVEDMLVRDADKLWRFTPAGIGIRLRLVQTHAVVPSN